MTPHNFLKIFALAVLCVLLLPATAGAQSAEREAQVYFEKGAAFYFEGEYGQALVQFKKGHSTLPNALFQYNIALCNLKLERYAEALNAARDADRMGGLGEKEMTQNKARIAAIPRLQSATIVAEDVSSAQQAEIATSDVIEAGSGGDGAETSSGGGFGGLGWAGVGFTTLGVGMLVGALVVEASLQSKWDEFNSVADSGNTTRFEELKGEIERSQTTGKVLLYAGIGASAIGVTLLIAELVTSPGSDKKRVSLYVTPAGDVGVGASFRF